MKQIKKDLNTLRDHCKEFCEGKDSIWAKDIEAIDMAIKELERQDADGCVNCKYVDKEEWEPPCCKCSRCCKDYWRAKE